MGGRSVGNLIGLRTILEKLIVKCNLLFAKWLSTGHHSDRQRYVS